jgi:hypothetical protein
MFHFAKRRAAGSKSEAESDRPRSRQPITIGFEQLEGREMMSAGLCMIIIPDPSWPMMSLPRPYVGSFNPESPTVSMTPRADPAQDREPAPTRLWTMRGRFRWRGLDRG